MSHDHSIDRSLILGCGYTGKVLARKLQKQGSIVWATTRDAERSSVIEKIGVQPVVWEWPKPLPNVDATVAFILFPPSRDIDPGALAKALTHIPRVVYCSSTGVYGTANGDWVDEDTPPNENAVRAAPRLATERALAAKKAVIVRAAGIYGPGRNMIERLRAGRLRVAGQLDRFVNLIHVDDLASILMTAALRGGAGSVYLAADGNPAPWQTLANAASSAAGIGLPPVSEVPDNPFVASFYTSSRRCRNDRIIGELGVTLAYPNAVDALAQLV